VTDKLTSEHVAHALAVMKESIDYFPKTPLGLEIVQDSIERHVSTGEELKRLVRIACDTMHRWSLPEFLALRASVSERAYYERELKENERKLRAWKKEAKLLGSGEPEPFEGIADAVKRMPDVPPPSATPPPSPKPVKRIPSLREAEAELTEQLTQSKRRSEEESARILADLELQLGVKKLTDVQ
jgi:hypothetical protein